MPPLGCEATPRGEGFRPRAPRPGGNHHKKLNKTKKLHSLVAIHSKSSIMYLIQVALVALCLFMAQATAGSNEKSKKWLEENKGKEGVVVLPSGLQYKVLRKGGGSFHPTVSSPCECHYKGTLIDGTQFDS